MALSWQSLQVPDLKNMTTVTGGGSFAGLASSGIARLQSMSLYGQRLDWEDDDNFNINNNQIIEISCPTKKYYTSTGSIVGYLSDPIKLSGQSDWEDVSSNQMVNTIYKLIETVDQTQQMGFLPVAGNNSAGVSYIQPWASRKFWKGSKPLNLTFNFNLVSFGDAQKEVYNPAVFLLSLCYPRKLENVATAESLVKENELLSSIFDVGGTLTTGSGENLTTAVLTALKPWAIPGPSLSYGGANNGNNNGQGDTVTVTIGNLFAFGACYVNQVNLEFSPTLDGNGYPLYCKCSISFTPSESNYCLSDGEFNFGSFSNGANELADVLTAISVTGTTLIKDFIAHEKALINALKP